MDIQERLAYGTPQHDKLKRAIQERYDLSYRKMAERYPVWEETDKLFKAYVTKKQEDQVRTAQRKAGAQTYITLNIPYSYAMLLTAHTYWTTVFLSRDPVFQFSGRHGETQQSVQAVEALLDYQVSVGGMLVPFYIWLLDAGKYGTGILGNYWAEDYETVVQLVDEPVTVFGIPTGKTKQVKQITRIPGYKGNKVFNVRPYDFFPDPRVPAVDFQRGEFAGRMIAESWNTILKGAANGDYFNIGPLQRVVSEKSGEMQRRVYGSSVDNQPLYESDSMRASYGGKPFSELLEMTIELVPKEWDLGEGSAPEKWNFTLASDEVVIKARPQGAFHNRFPFFLLSYEITGYEQGGRGMLEICKPLNDTLSWLINSHYYNVRKALNDQLVVDPSKINMKDLTEGGPGRIIRLQPSAWGTDVRQAITQLPVMDITQQHIPNSKLIEEMMQRATGVTDNLQGLVNSGGRKTATEVRTSSSFGVNRLKTFSEFNSALGWQPLSMVLLQNTQQYYDDEQTFRVAGDLLQGAKYVKVSPEMIAGFYNYVPVDGTMPIDRYAQANLWKEIILGISQIPQLAMNYDVAGMFGWMAQLAGLKNITQFRVNVMPDQQLAAMAADGEVSPTGQVGGELAPRMPPAVTA
jgi:hypothetical protein